ncbi:hypothetical protein AB0E25_37190 [Streptomyces bobili]|uniref:hypothetical protein n=1 Tax=Streptomyces bobili TaxID=67280 RepID=UPI00340AD2CF
MTVWLEGFGEEDEALILANRSLHPVPVEVYGMRIHYKRTTPHDDTVESISQGHEIVLGVLPPCSRVTFTHDLLMRNSADEDPESPFPRVDDFDPDGIVFMDATGQKWRRGLSGKLSRASDIQLPLAFYDFDELDVGTPIRETKPAKLTPCSVQ